MAVGATLLATQPAAALEGAGTIPGSFGFIPILIDDFDRETNDGTLFTLIRIFNTSNRNVTIHYFYADENWLIRDICYSLTPFDIDFFDGLGHTHFINTDDGGFAWWFVTDFVGPGKVPDVNGAPCGTTQQSYDEILMTVFFVDVPNNTAFILEAITLEANFPVAIPDDGRYTFGPQGSNAEYRGIFPNIWYVEFLPQQIVTTQVGFLLVPNPLFNEQVQQTPFAVLNVRTWNDLEEPLPSVQVLTFLCWGMPTVEDLAQVDLSLFTPDGGWLRLVKLFGGDLGFPAPPPEALLVTIDTVGGPYTVGMDWSGQYYTHHARTTTETVIP